VRLHGDRVNAKNIKKRPRFYNEKTIPMKYRTKYKDYTGYGKKWNRGHFIVADADFDYRLKALRKAYTMANIQPQAAKLNQKTWIKVERYGRKLATKYGYIDSISIADYRGASKTIKNNIVIPTGFYRIYYNDQAGFKSCFYYKNVLDIDVKHNKMKDHLVDCSTIRY
jgi:endonuclease G